jgi:Tol biopolymer transport system component
MIHPSQDEPPRPESGTPYRYVPRVTDDEAFGAAKRWRLLGLIGVALIIILIGLYFVQRFRTAVRVPSVVTQILPVSQWTTDPGLSISPAFSHDGKIVAYASDRDGPGNLAIWLRPYRSGVPSRLTKEEFNATDPDFSPDDSQIVYHSDRDGGGIYITSVSGAGQPKLLAKGGMRPRFSPDGKWIAYYTVTSDGIVSPFGSGRLYLVPPQGGVPKQLRADFPYARYPVWRAGGQLLLFEGANGQGSRDWWVSPIDGGDAIRTHAFERMNGVTVRAAPECWERDKILFSASRGSNLHLWELDLEPRGWQAIGNPRQLTNSDGIDQTGAISPDGRMLFGTMQVTLDIWTLSLDGVRGKPAGAPQRITDDHALNQTPAVGLNTANMVYVSNKTGTRDIWVHDLKTGLEWALTAYNRVNYRPVLSPDENRVAYGTAIDNHCAIVLQDLDRTSRRDLVTGCFNIWDWSPDGSSLLIIDPAEAAVSAQLLKLESGQRQPLISHPNFSVFDAGFSRDGKWIAFSAGSTLAESEVFIAPFHGAAIKEADWIPVSRGPGSLSAWSADGGTLYYHSNRDGFHCIWAQELDSAKHPVGDSYAIQHLHSVAFGMYIIRPNDFHMSATKDHLVFNLTKETANLWLTAKRE